MNEQLKEVIRDAIHDALGDALDCNRVWSAWGAGTMSEDDFSQVADDPSRVEEITDAVLAAIAANGKQRRAWWHSDMWQPSTLEDAIEQMADMREDWADMGRRLGFDSYTDVQPLLDHASELAKSAGNPAYSPQQMAASFRAGQNTERMQAGDAQGDTRVQFEAWAKTVGFGIQRDENGDYLEEASHGGWCAWNHLAATGKQQVGEVQGDAREVALGILADAYEQDGNDAAARSVRDGDLMYGAKIAVSAIMSALAARQPGGQEPVAVVSSETFSDDGTSDIIKPGLLIGTKLYRDPPAQGWVVADGQGARWRMWGDSGPEWTCDRDAALHFARRSDAEAFARDDEDAWLIQPVGAPAQDGAVHQPELPQLPSPAHESVSECGPDYFDASQMRQYARAAIAATGKQPLQVGEAESVDDDWHLRGYAYASKQATTCAGCGKHKHTPLRIDAMGGYVCLTCIDQKLGTMLNEFGYESEQVGEVQVDGLANQAMLDAGLAALLSYRKSGGDYTTHPAHAVEAVINAALAARQPVANRRNPLLAYADSYKVMASMGDGRVSASDVAFDIEKNMVPHAAPPAQGIDLDSMYSVARKAWDKHQAECRFTTVGGSLMKVCKALIDGQRDAAPGVE